jgi:hypothetical protein
VRYFVTITGPVPWAGYVEAESAEQARYAAHDAMLEYALGGRAMPTGTEINAVPMPIDGRPLRYSAAANRDARSSQAASD